MWIKLKESNSNIISFETTWRKSCTYLTIKRGNRLWNLNLKRQKHIKELFAIRLIDAMKSEKDIINIDESCFNKNTKWDIHGSIKEITDD